MTQEQTPTTDLKKRFEDLQKSYLNDHSKDTFKIVVLGTKGAGKTTFACTGRRPIYMYSFDPDGPRTVKDLIESGELTVIDCEEERIQSPRAYKKFKQQFDQDIESGLLNKMGTVIIDSMTTFSDAALHKVQLNAGRPGQKVQLQDYGEHVQMIMEVMTDLMNLEADVVLCGHLLALVDQVTEKIVYDLLTAGRLARVKPPILFSEVYTLLTKRNDNKTMFPTGLERVLLTVTDGTYPGTTRHGAKGRFDIVEKPDIMHLRKKAGLSTELWREGWK